MKIHTKLTITFFLMTLIPLIILGTFSLYITKKIITQQILDQLISVSSIQKDRIVKIIDQNFERVALVASRTQLRLSLESFIKDRKAVHQNKMNKILRDAKSSIKDFQEISILTTEGQIVASTNRAKIGRSYSNKVFFSNGLKEKFVDILSIENINSPGIFLSGPLYLEDTLIGVVVIESSINDIISLASDYSGLGKTGETILLKKDINDDILYLTPLRFVDQTKSQRIISPEASNSLIIQALMRKEQLFSDYIDYRGIHTFASLQYIEKAKWGLIVKIDKDERYKQIEQLQGLTLLLLIITGIVLIIISYFVGRSITKPINELSKAAEEISKGDLSRRVYIKASGEIGKLGKFFNKMAENLVRNNINLEKKIKARREELEDVNTDLLSEIYNREQAEAALKISHGFLKIANRHLTMKPLLNEFIEEITKLTDCSSIGIRILDNERNVPYQAIHGFSEEFYQEENEVSIKEDKCLCSQVIARNFDPELPYYTRKGSFYTNDLQNLGDHFSNSKLKKNFRYVCGKQGFQSMTLIPLRLRDDTLGLIHIADKEKDKISLELVEILEKVGLLLGAAIKRVRAEEELLLANTNLEKRIKERTSKLDIANKALKLEVDEHERTSKKLKKLRDESRRLSAHLQSVREEERTHISREIHDELGQSLTALKMDVSWLSKKLPASDEMLVDKANSMNNLIDATIKSVKRICSELRPGLLDDLGLAAAIEWQTEDFSKRTGIAYEIKIKPEEIIMDQDRLITVFRIFQETLTNIAKHANASKVKINLEKEEEQVVLEVIDDGVGITDKNISKSNSFGLIGMRERVYFWKGKINICGEKNKGTTIKVMLPLENNSGE